MYSSNVTKTLSNVTALTDPVMLCNVWFWHIIRSYLICYVRYDKRIPNSGFFRCHHCRYFLIRNVARSLGLLLSFLTMHLLGKCSLVEQFLLRALINRTRQNQYRETMQFHVHFDTNFGRPQTYYHANIFSPSSFSKCYQYLSYHYYFSRNVDFPCCSNSYQIF